MSLKDDIEGLHVSPFTAHQANGVRRPLMAAIQSGFTIIEVMIVLAIAALILVIVFMAVPALQRSQRNNARKSESSRMAAAIVEFAGSTPARALPTTQANCNSLVASVGTLAQYALNTTCPVPTGAAWPASIASNNLYIMTGPIATASPTAIAEVMILAEQNTCGNQAPASTWTPAAGAAKNGALLYSVESGGSYVWNCVNPQ